MKHVEAKRFLYKVRGECQAFIVEAQDSSFYILKLANNSNPNLLFNEAFGSQLIAHFQLPMASWMPVLLTDAFIDSNRELWPEGEQSAKRPSAGFHFGSKLITSKHGAGAFQLIPSSWLSRVVNAEDFVRVLAIDLWANHCDRRQAIFTVMGQKLHATFIDNGHMFGGPAGLDQTCPRRAMIYNLRLYQGFPMEQILEACRQQIDDVSERALQTFLESIPREWDSDGLAQKVITQLLLRRAKLPSLFRETSEVLRTGSSAVVNQFVNSIEARS
jgi:hypothetical protein